MADTTDVSVAHAVDPLESLDALPHRAGELDAFISYARRPADLEFVDRLWHGLRDAGKQVWLDRSSIEPGADWRQRIGRGIEAASCLIFVVTPESAGSGECLAEVELATEGNKRIVPVVLRQVDAGELPAELTRWNWIDFENPERFSEAFAQLLEALEADIEWRDAHARLATRSREWRDSRQERSLLLRGSDLRAAEDWYGRKADHEVQPTDAQYQFIVASRRGASRRLRFVSVAVVVGLVVALGATALAVVQRQSAVTKASQAQSELMAAEAQNLLSTNTPVGVQVALAAYERAPTSQARSIVAQAAELRLERMLTMPRTAGALALAFGPGGSIAAAGDAASSLSSSKITSVVAIWHPGYPADPTTWTEDTPINSNVAFSPDGRLLAFADTGRVIMWNLRLGTRTFWPEPGDVESVAFRPDGRTLATGDFDGKITLWDVATGTVLRSWNAGGGNVGVTFSPDGTRLASVDVNGQVAIWDIATATRIDWWNNGSSTWKAAFSPDGATLATVDEGGQIVLWNVSTGNKTILADGSNLTNVAYSPDGRTLAVSDVAGQVTLWNMALQSRIATWNAGSPVGGLAFSSDGRTVAAGDTADQILLSDVSTIDSSGASTGFALSPDGRTLAVMDGSGVVSTFDTSSGHRVVTSSPSGVSVAFRPDGRAFAVGGSSGFEVRELNGHTRQFADPSGIQSLTFSPDGKTVVGGDGGGATSLWNVATGTHVILQPVGGDIYATAFSPNRRYVASGSYNGRLNVWELSNHKWIDLNLCGCAPIASVAFSPDSRTVAGGDWGGSVAIWNIKEHRVVQSWQDSNHVDVIAYSPDGTRLAIGDSQGETTIWNLQTSVKTSVNFGNTITGLAFTPDGRSLVVDDGQVQRLPTALWEGSFGPLESQLCQAVGGDQLTRSQFAQYVPDQTYRKICP